MTLVIGTDEAGFGPNLGPLVVAATAWRVAAGGDVDHALATAIEAAGGVPWDDSKRVFKAGAGLAALERPTLAALAMVHGRVPDSWPALLADVAAAADPAPPEALQLAGLRLPRETAAATAVVLADELRAALESAGVTLVAVRARVVQPAAFNGLLAAGRNKSDILSQTTLELAAALRGECGDPRAVVWCDRHGGRHRYAALVARHFDEPLVQTLEETAERSVYQAGTGVRIEFCVGGESRVPVALASMTAKYLREVSMAGFNAHWCGLVPGLGPTAGYPVDALRWRRAVESAPAPPAVAWDAVWRRA